MRSLKMINKKNNLPPLLTSLFIFATSSKFNHVLASCTLATIRRLANLEIKQIGI